METKTKIKMILAGVLSAVFTFSVFSFVFVPEARAANATLSISPNSGTFMVDSTFDVSIYLDTQERSINTLELNLKFPPDKLQLVSSSTGKSIIGIWTSLPKFDNQHGTISLVGGIPGGINVSRGLVASFTFRAKAVGTAVIKFENSLVLLNDGFGTEIPTQNQNSVFDLVLPPPAGPIVVSETHPDQTRWYKQNSVSLRWGEEGGSEGFSYILSSNPIDIPDQISEGTRRNVVYQNLSDGRHYFHIRALRDGAWGGITHFAINIDATPPAEFVIDIIPSAKTTKRQPVIQFATSDASSGLDHYEIRVVPLNKPANVQDTEFFIETQSPYVPSNLELGKYDIIVRAYDKAGNYREQIKRMEISNAIFQHISGEGVEIRSMFVLAWWQMILMALIIFLILLFIIWRLHLWHRIIDHRRENRLLPGQLQDQMDELQRYRERYGKLTSVMALLIGISLFGSIATASAQSVMTPPVITTISQNISDDEIFYIGGRTDVSSAEVVLYMQNLNSAATISHTVKADREGQWFYRHDNFLSSGSYLLWAQTKLGDQLSPPSPQYTLSVENTAIKFGSSRISYTALYVSLLLLFMIMSLIMALFILYKFLHGRKKHAILLKEVSEAEESIKRGFAILNRDIMAELEIIRGLKMSKKVAEEERLREEQLLKDLENIEQYLSKEVWDIEKAERVR
jgi:hypothetical protein